MAERETEMLGELTPESRIQYERYKKYKAGKKSKYNAMLKETTQDMLSTEISIDGANMTVAEKIVMGVLQDVVDRPNVDKLIGLAKITGEYSEKAEVKVSDFNTILEKLKGDEF